MIDYRRSLNSPQPVQHQVIQFVGKEEEGEGQPMAVQDFQFKQCRENYVRVKLLALRSDKAIMEFFNKWWILIIWGYINSTAYMAPVALIVLCLSTC